MATASAHVDRKRSLRDDGAETDHASQPCKRMHSSGSLGQDQKEEDQDDESDEEQNPAYKGLEAFRKEAIFRQMLESKRDLIRAEKKRSSLERALSESQDRFAAFNILWESLVADIEANIEVSPEDLQALHQATPLTLNSPAVGVFNHILEDRTRALKRILSRLYKGDAASTGPDLERLRSRCQESASEAIALRVQLDSSQAEVAESRLALERATNQLRRLEKQVDRLRSPTVLASERPSAAKVEEAEKARAEVSEAEKAQAERRRAAAQADLGEDSATPNHSEHTARLDAEISELRKLSDARLLEADELRSELTKVKQKCEKLQGQAEDLPEEKIRATTMFQEVEAQIRLSHEETTRLRSVAEGLETENANLREKRHEFHQATAASALARSEELEKLVKTRDADVTRLRSQRDDLNAELSERRQREQVKFSQIEEMKALVNSKEERSSIFVSEIRRLRLKVASLRGEGRSVEMLKEASSDDELVEKLSTALKRAEDSLNVANRELEAYRDSSGVDADMVKKLVKLQEEADFFVSLMGKSFDAMTSDDVAEKLRWQQGRIKDLELALTAAETSSAALCEEVDKLSLAYGEMERQASSKVMDLSRMEEKVLRLTTEKSKADNKYFSAMRAKESVESERRAALRNVERQVKVIEHYAEAEKTFSSQLALHEKEITAFKRGLQSHTVKISELETDLQNTRSRLNEMVKLKALAEEEAQKQIALAVEEGRQRKRAEEKTSRLERELEHAKRQLANATKEAARGKGKETSSYQDAHLESLNSLLRCSACKERYRDRIITKCLHTFCSVCVETRIQTRQRKCPHCGLSFAISDVQTLYLQ